MKAPHWTIGILIPAAMVLLGYFVFNQHNEEVPELEGPFCMIAVDSLQENSLSNARNSGLIPFLSGLSDTGVRCNLKLRKANNLQESRLEMITGKEVDSLHAAGVTLDPEYHVKPFELRNQKHTPVWKMAEDFGKKILLVENPDTAESVDWNEIDLAIVTFSRSEMESDPEYLRRLDLFCGKLYSMPRNPPAMAIVSPFTLTRCDTIFRINRWLMESGYLSIHDSKIDWQKTRAFVAGIEDNGIRINRKNLYPSGIVEEGECRTLCQEIAEGLMKIKLPDSDEPVLEKILAGETVYSKRLPGSYPELVFSYNMDNRSIFFDLSLDTTGENGIVSMNNSDSCLCPQKTGGFLFLNGHPFISNYTEDHIMNADVTPTILYALRLPRAKDMAGRVLLTAFQNNWLEYAQPEVETYDRRDFRVQQPFDPIRKTVK